MSMRNHGADENKMIPKNIDVWGTNCRLDNLHAAILSYKMDHYERDIDRRRQIAQRYHDAFKRYPAMNLPEGPEEQTHFDIFQNYEIRTPHRDALRKHLGDNGVGTIIQWGGLALHDLTGLGIACKLEEATRFFEETMLLPMNHMLNDEQVDYVIESVQQFFSERAGDMISELGDLADPSKFRAPVELGDVSREDALAWYRKLVEIRKVEELTADIVLSGEVYTPCHLSIGQEAVAVGVANSLTADDFIYSNHRSHAHFLALGGPMDGLLAEILCRDSGVSGGLWRIAASDLRGSGLPRVCADRWCDDSDCGRGGVFGEIQQDEQYSCRVLW